MVDLTKRQQEIFDFIKRYSAKYGYPPTVRDIGKAVGLASSSTVHAHLANLEKLGLLRRDPTKPRAIELLDRVREDVGEAVESMAENVRNLVRPGLPVVGQGGGGQGAGGPRASRSWPRRTSRTTCRSRPSRAARRASTCCACAASR